MKMIILRKVSQDADIKCIFGTTSSGIKLAQIVKIFMHRASTMFYFHYRAVLNLHGRYVLLHFNEITDCYCFGTHTQINCMPRCLSKVLRRTIGSFYSLPYCSKIKPRKVVPEWHDEWDICMRAEALHGSPMAIGDTVSQKGGWVAQLVASVASEPGDAGSSPDPRPSK